MVGQKPAKDVRGLEKFNKLVTSFDENNPLLKEIHETAQLLNEDCTRGDKIQHNLWSCYRNYKINNLWRFPLSSGWRLIYTIVGESDGFVVYIFEVLPHDEYEKRFNY